jgi:hypothetical protein
MRPPAFSVGRGARLLVVAAATALLAYGAGALADRPEGESASHVAPVNLLITFDNGSGVRKAARLTCTDDSRRASGFLRRRDPRRLCWHARRQARFLASEPDPNRVCALVYGGPETARFRGTIGSRRIDRRFARGDGCEIADWDRVSYLLPRVASSPQPDPTY